MSDAKDTRHPLLLVLPNRRQSADQRCSSAYTSKIVAIEVGTDEHKRTFNAHHGLLTFYSGYFKSALDGGFAEAQSGVIKLETEDSAVFEPFITWLYTHKAGLGEPTLKNATPYYMSIVKLWIFADRREIPLLMNEMVDLLQQIVVSVWSLPQCTLQEVYESTTDNSALRRMLVHLYQCIGASLKAGISNLETYPKDFLLDLVESLSVPDSRKRLGKTEYEKVNMCGLFHVHEEGVSCPRKGTKRSKDEMER